MAEPAAEDRKRILVGVPSFKRPDGLSRLLRSLAGQRHVEDLDVQVFVADNDPEGCEADALCKELSGNYRWPLDSQVVSTPGISAARNAILDHARASGVDYVAMIDDDEEAEPTWLHELVEMQRNTAADVVGGPVYYLLEQVAPPTVRKSGAFMPRPWEPGPVPLIDATGNVLLACDALERNGWPAFDHAFGTTGGGDKEFFVRLRRSGARFAWAPAAVVSEHVPASRTSRMAILRRAYRVGNGDLRITRLHEGRAATMLSLAKASALLLAAPVAAPLLLVPSRRLWLMRKWARSLGKLAALRGRHYHEYRRPSARGVA